MDIEEAKKKFIEIYQANIKREGSVALLEYLKSSDFFTAPASTRFHLAVEGGLCAHSINVYNRLLNLVKLEYGEDWESKKKGFAETVAICGLLHDVCKIDTYKVAFRNVKTEQGWESRPYYTMDEELPYGHGEKSVYIINGFMRLTREEAMAINWHMGSFDDRVRGGSYAISGAYERYPLAVLMHLADLSATYLDEKRS
ncbi:MAG: HD domain-containing protein [Clostridiales bacterium]|nr:HD domain-containing protein [Clostridiales bacterium]HPO53578.1 HD domain-containing protein [Clostridia bacterium]